MSIKVIENMEPDEVMRVHRIEGKRVACRYKGEEWREMVSIRMTSLQHICHAVSQGKEIGIIDDSQPELTAEWWEGFDWEFFNRYGGLPVDDYGKEILSTDPAEAATCETVAESPFYYWQGGKCPVPENVEVETLGYFLKCDPDYLGRRESTSKALDVAWSNPNLVAFRLTGRIL